MEQGEAKRDAHYEKQQKILSKAEERKSKKWHLFLINVSV